MDESLESRGNDAHFDRYDYLTRLGAAFESGYTLGKSMEYRPERFAYDI